MRFLNALGGLRRVRYHIGQCLDCQAHDVIASLIGQKVPNSSEVSELLSRRYAKRSTFFGIGVF